MTGRRSSKSTSPRRSGKGPSPFVHAEPGETQATDDPMLPALSPTQYSDMKAEIEKGRKAIIERDKEERSDDLDKNSKTGSDKGSNKQPKRTNKKATQPKRAAAKDAQPKRDRGNTVAKANKAKAKKPRLTSKDVTKSTYKFPAAVPAPKGFSRVCALPDTQFGYRQLPDGSLDPIHDVEAIQLAINISAAIRPDIIVHLGDQYDFPEFGHFVNEPTLMRSTQATLDYGKRYYADCERALKAGGKQVALYGNHEARWAKYIAENAPLLFGIRDAESGEAMIALDRVTGVKQFNIETVEYRKGGLFGWWLDTGTTLFTHGDSVSSSGSTAASYANKATNYNTVFGHIHSQELHWTTKRMAGDKSVDVFACSPGALCRNDGAVPGFSSSLAADGTFKDAFVDWQQGMAVVTYKPGVPNSEIIEMIKFTRVDGVLTALYNGKVYTV